MPSAADPVVPLIDPVTPLRKALGLLLGPAKVTQEDAAEACEAVKVALSALQYAPIMQVNSVGEIEVVTDRDPLTIEKCSGAVLQGDRPSTQVVGAMLYDRVRLVRVSS